MAEIRCFSCKGPYFMVIGKVFEVKRHWFGLWNHHVGYTVGCIACGARQTVTRHELIRPGAVETPQNGTPAAKKRDVSRVPDRDMNWSPDAM